jgi:hypothetical protein
MLLVELEGLLGDQAIRTLAADARSGLDTLVALYRDEGARYTALLDAVTLAADAPAELRRLADNLATS